MTTSSIFDDNNTHNNHCHNDSNNNDNNNNSNNNDNNNNIKNLISRLKTRKNIQCWNDAKTASLATARILRKVLESKDIILLSFSHLLL